jgi:hypothetical protein
MQSIIRRRSTIRPQVEAVVSFTAKSTIIYVVYRKFYSFIVDNAAARRQFQVADADESIAARSGTDREVKRMPSRSRAAVEANRPPAESGALVARDTTRTNADPAPDDGGDIPAGIQLSDRLASRRCAAQVAAALEKLGYGFAVIPATAKPKRPSRTG